MIRVFNIFSIVTTNIDAVEFYQKYGFKIYRTKLRPLKGGTHFYDEILMGLNLEKDQIDI